MLPLSTSDALSTAPPSISSSPPSPLRFGNPELSQLHLDRVNKNPVPWAFGGGSSAWEWKEQLLKNLAGISSSVEASSVAGSQGSVESLQDQDITQTRPQSPTFSAISPIPSEHSPVIPVYYDPGAWGEKYPREEILRLSSDSTGRGDVEPSSRLMKEVSKEELSVVEEQDMKDPELSQHALDEMDETYVPWGADGGSLSEWKERVLKSRSETSHSHSVGVSSVAVAQGSVESFQDQADIGSRSGEATSTQNGTPSVKQETSESPANVSGPELVSLIARHEREIEAVKEEVEAFESIIAKGLESGNIPVHEGEIEVIKRTRIHLREEAERMILRLEEELALHRSGRVQMQDSKTENVQVVLPESTEEDIPLPPPRLVWFGHDNKRNIRDRLRLGSELTESPVTVLSQDPWLGSALANEQIGYDERPSRSRFKAILRLRAIITRGWKSVVGKFNEKPSHLSTKVEIDPDLTTITPIIPRVGTYSNPWAQIVANQSSAVEASVLASGATNDVRLDTTSPMLTSTGEIGPASSALIPHEEGIDVDLEILNDMRRLVEGVMEDEQQLKELLETKGEDAQSLLDALQVLAKLSDVATNLRSLMLKMMLQLSKRSGLCPQCLMIENVERLGDRPVAHGGFGDVWKGKIGQQIVCLKTVKVYEFSDISKLLKEYMREAIVWEQLKHPNLLPFLGMCYLDKAQTQLCLVSPWMERGNLVRFLENTPRADVDHYSLVYDVASGLSYLHDEDIVHGDLKGLNVLITPDERACIADFGLSRVQGTHKFGLTSTKIDKGTTRYSSPELLTGSNSSLSSDIYAFGCVCYEIFEGKAPFHELKLDASVIATVLIHKKHPSRPELTSLNDTMWEIMVDCWAVEPWKRPEASDVLTRVVNLECLVGEEEGRGSIKPAPSWDVYPLSVIGKNVKRPRLDVAALTQLQKNLGCLSQVRSSALRAQDSPKVREEEEDCVKGRMYERAEVCV